MPHEKIDLELVMIDPVYRREVIDRLNAEVRRSGEVAGDAAPGQGSEVGANRSPADD